MTKVVALTLRQRVASSTTNRFTLLVAVVDHWVMELDLRRVIGDGQRLQPSVLDAAERTCLIGLGHLAVE